MAAPQASSRLEMLQARFQQKQLQEKEQKLLQLYDQQQQRAYQVAQRGSSGSNGSGQGTSTVNHHHQIVTRTSSSGHTTSTSQATKVKQQVFNDRRQTTSVKGIDRSYPLEPLDNKTRKQPTSNGIGNSRNNGLTVNRQSITVKRVTRSDLNSNVNDGKPIVSYHEEITRESSSSRDVPHTIESPKEDDIEVFDNENHTAHYVNGNYPDQVQMENIMDEDTIQRNRMMAKLHLMQYDETLKYRVKNDLESEEFPEELLIEVTDKIPKRTVSKKLSQAEARLERFKNMNAKRNNAIKLSNSTTTGSKKRSEPLLPSSRTNSRINKSPSPESLNSKKSSDTDCRTTVLTRRSVPSSPSKSPDILPRRVSNLESKIQETKPSIKSSFVKASDSITSKRSTTRTDVPNVLQNGLHLQEQIVERKEQNELPKKCQAFTIDFEERPSSKTNDSTDSKRPLAKKQSVEKQQYQTSSSSNISGRPTSSTSSVSNGNPIQTQISSSKGRMATRTRTPISNTPTSKGSACVKSGLGQNATENLAPCKVCGRRFAQDRVTLHEQICAKTVQKKRKQFDTTMYRVKGTELESFVKKGSKKNELKSKKPEVKSNWRRKHEEFINAIRSAKQVQAHLAAGGRLSDLPPPPVSDTSDYIQCPHCGRKFNQAAAERHIPKCEHMLHNKPSSRPAPPRPRR